MPGLPPDPPLDTSRRADQMVQPARLISCRMRPRPGQLVVAELFFEVPLDHGAPGGPTLKLFGRAATKHARPLDGPDDDDDAALRGSDPAAVFTRPWMLYLEGGPGFGNKEPQDHALTRPLLARGYQVLYLDYRGTGLSAPVDGRQLARLGPPAQQAEHLRRFRADSIVRDCEAVRLCLTPSRHPPARRRWSLFGQSYGGFVATTYLSRFPDGLREVFVTGGLPPLGRPAEDVYRATYRRVAARNQAYLRAFPEDLETLQQVALFLAGEEGAALPLPGGGSLTFARVLTLGNALGMHGGVDLVHAVVLRMKADLMQLGTFSRATLRTIEDFWPLDACPIHAILHEAIYCSGKGQASRWAALRVGQELEHFRWLRGEVTSEDILNQSVFFSGEMIYPFMFDVFPGLAPLKEAADLLAEYDGWDELYDEAQLARNTVPVYAASYMDDMYVDWDLARETEQKVANLHVFHTNTLYHNAVRARPDEVLAQLFRLRDETLD